LKELGVEMVRYTFYDSSGGDRIDPAKADFYRQKARAYAEAGIDSLVILTYDTYPNRPSPDAPDRDWDNYIERFARRAGQIALQLAPWRPAYQVWNEPDHPPKGNYVPTLREAVFGRMLRRTRDAVKAADPRAQIVMAGLAMGDPSWLTRVINSLGGQLPADIVAFHPYGQRPESNWPRSNWGFGYVGDLLNGYYRAGQRKPIWITEMGIKVDEVDNNPDQAAEFLRRYYKTATTSLSDKVQKLLWFCYSDGMVNPFGLVDANGNRKPAYFAYLRAAASRPTEPAPAVGTTTPTVSPPPAVDLPAAPTPPTASPTPELAELANQVAGLANQIQQLQTQMTQFQGQLQDLSNRQNQLQTQFQQWQSQPTPGSGVAPTTPPAPAPVAPTPPVVHPSPAPATKPAPPIQNIIQLLRRDPTQQFETRSLGQIQRIIIHHTAIPAQIGADRIANYGVEKKGWPAIKYHYFISGEALIQQTNELTTLSTHAGPYSSISIGIGFAGDFTNTIPTPAQIDSGARLIAWLLPQFGLSVQDVVGYKELINTQSPGAQWDGGLRWGDRLKERIQAYL
jgi:hypothetical protein